MGTWQVWCEVQTQWRVGPGGQTGLDYAGVRAHLDESGVDGGERREIWECLRAAELAALEVWTEKRNKAQCK